MAKVKAPWGMSSDGPTPRPCNKKIFKKGVAIAMLQGSSNAIEDWVQAVAVKAKAQVDWHYVGGKAIVLHLGTAASLTRTLEVMLELQPLFKGSRLQ
jgi:hypothetical protein